MTMQVSQHLENINEQNYEDEITITDIPRGFFPAVTAMSSPDGGTTRDISVTIMALEMSEGGTMNVNSGLFVKNPDETAVKVTVFDFSGKELADNTISYN